MIPADPTGRKLMALRLDDEDAFIHRVGKALCAPTPGDRMKNAAKLLGVSRRTVFRWIDRYPQLTAFLPKKEDLT